MTIPEYIAEKRAQLAKLEESLEQRAHLESALAPWHAKKDEITKRLESLASETSERWDIVRMGFESAWAELQAAYDALVSKEPKKEREQETHPR